jgi:serine/threonine protein kinase
VQQIGRYQILGELGRGAMGVVYRAQDPAIGRPIAIKAIRLSELTDEAERERLHDRLLREAQSAGILSHPNIVTIYDIQEGGGLTYIFMEFVNGPALEKLLSSDQPPDKSMLMGVLRQTAAALDYAHKKGIIHRDIKPANIMIHDDGTAKITDFGVAKIVSQQITQSGTMMGTPSYMSPEQVQGITVNGRADQFALGVIAYEMLTGERPFIADYLPTLLYKICRDDPAPPQRLNPTLDAAVDGVLRQALAKDPNDRFANCTDFVTALDRACNLSPDWQPMARGSSLNMPTVANMKSPAVAAAPPAVQEPAATVAPPRAPILSEPAVRSRVRHEETESHTVRNIVLALASIIVVGLIFLLSQQWFAPKPVTSVADNPLAAAPQVPEPAKPSPTPQSQSPAEPAKTAPAPQDQAKQTEPKSAEPDKTAEEEKPAPEPEAAKKTTTRPAVSRTPPPSSEVLTQILTSPPGARVLVDGNPQLACRAPCTLQLAPGRHTLYAVAEGYRDANRIFELPEESSLSVDMERTGGTLSISSNLAGSTIFINGQQRPEKTPALLRLPVGTYQVHIVNGNHQCDTVKLQDGSIARRTCDMQ